MQKIIFSTLIAFIFVTLGFAQNANPGTSIFSRAELEEKQGLDTAIYLLNSNQDEKAYEELNRQLKTLKTAYGITNVNLLLSNYFTKNSQWDSSTYYVKEALLSGEGFTNDSLKSRLFAFSYRQLGRNYSNQGNFGDAKKMYIKGLEASEKYVEEWLYYAITHQLSLVYSRTKEYDKALEGFKECLNYKEDPELLYGSYINIGDIYAYQKDYATSNEYLLKAESLCMEEDNLYGQAVILSSLAYNYQEQGDNKKAFIYYTNAITVADSIDHRQVQIIGRSGIGLILAEEYKDYNGAKRILSDALAKAIEYAYLSEQKTLYTYLNKVSLLENNYKDALQYSKMEFTIQDSIVRMQQNEDINNLEVKYKTKQKEKEIELLKKDKQLQALEMNRHKIIIVSFIVLFIVLVILAFQYLQRLKAQKILHEKQKVIAEKSITALMKEQELKLMEASIEGKEKERERIAQELHDSVGSNLAAIKLQLNQLENQKEAHIAHVKEHLDETYQQVREVSHSLIPKRFGDFAFCDVLHNYISNIDQASDLNTALHAYPQEQINKIDETIKIETFKIIQELITNVLKHANAKNIELTLNLLDEAFNIILEDDGCGFDTQKMSKGIGLTNINSRLDKLSGSFDVDSMPGRGTIINIEIPFTTNNKA